jgi:hypothetical protein
MQCGFRLVSAVSLHYFIVRERLGASRLPSASLRRCAALTRPARSRGSGIYRSDTRSDDDDRAMNVTRFATCIRLLSVKIAGRIVGKVTIAPLFVSACAPTATARTRSRHLNPDIGFPTPHSIELSTGTRCASLTFGEVEGGIALFDR